MIERTHLEMFDGYGSKRRMAARDRYHIAELYLQNAQLLKTEEEEIPIWSSLLCRLTSKLGEVYFELFFSKRHGSTSHHTFCFAVYALSIFVISQ
ncbi:hypothetical protein AB6A40_007910 [Gnathostoma spinigerum]|uniref:Uncharacterized protein n=1 Tax=Gnathostoma spinigerum TaxID=75299 RepID=A0ABD6EN43_9BILA